VDGSYNFKINTVGTGMVLVENGKIVTGYSNFRNIKTTKTTIRFVRILKGGKKNPLHKNAHFLSQEYKKEIFENLEIV
jgi:hypothetical protein